MFVRFLFFLFLPFFFLPDKAKGSSPMSSVLSLSSLVLNKQKKVKIRKKQNSSRNACACREILEQIVGASVSVFKKLQLDRQWSEIFPAAFLRPFTDSFLHLTIYFANTPKLCTSSCRHGYCIKYN